MTIERAQHQQAGRRATLFLSLTLVAGADIHPPLDPKPGTLQSAILYGLCADFQVPAGPSTRRTAVRRKAQMMPMERKGTRR